MISYLYSTLLLLIVGFLTPDRAQSSAWRGSHTAFVHHKSSGSRSKRLDTGSTNNSPRQLSPLYSNENLGNEQSEEDSRRRTIRKRVTKMAKNMLNYASPIMPQAIGAVLKDATLASLDLAVEEVLGRRANRGKVACGYNRSEDGHAGVDINFLIDEAFAPVESSLHELESSLHELESSLQQTRTSLARAKSQATYAIGAIQAAAIAQADGAVSAVAAAEEKVIAEIYAETNNVNVSSLTFDDVDYESSEMAPPFIDEDQCLVPGEPVCRVEKALDNSRRIFAGIDIMASVDDVWNVLTDYANLQKVVPNLVVNEVLDLYDATVPQELALVDKSLPEDQQCAQIANQMKGALLKQVGGAKVAGINFSARTTLEVREWPLGMPDFAHFTVELWDGKNRKLRAKDYEHVKLERYRFPRPFAVSSLPTKDISMQSIKNDDGEFRMYQGVWRMQPLPGCAPPGQQAMRLTYAVEVSPRAYLPVRFVEGRIVKDLCANLEAIRDYVAQKELVIS
jgi:hypothetical protein